MTRSAATSTKSPAKKTKRLSLSKSTLKDLTQRGSGPMGGRNAINPRKPNPSGG